MLGIYFAQGQSISITSQLSPNICEGSIIELDFEVRSGIFLERFDSRSTYYILLQDSLGEYYILDSFTSRNSTNLFNGYKLSFTRQFQIPSGIPSRTVYNIIVLSTEPEALVASNTFTINTLPPPPSVGEISQPSCTAATGSVVLNGLPVTGNWTLTKLPGGQTKTGTGTSTTFTGLTAGTHTFTVANANGCNSSASADVFITNPPPTPAAPTIGQITQPTCTTSTGSVALSGLPSGNWTITESPGGLTKTGTGASTTFTGLSASTHKFTVNNETGCTSPASANVTIDAPPNPTAPLVSSINQPTCTTATGSVTLSGLPLGNWTINPGGITGSGATKTITGLTPGNYTYTVDVPNTTTGLKAEYFNNRYLSGAPSFIRTDATVNFNWGSGNPGSPVNSDNFSVKWSGQIQPLYSENYTFKTKSDDGIRLWINGTRIINNWTDHSVTSNTGTINLTAGLKYDIVLEYYENGGDAIAELYWSSRSQSEQIIPESQLFSEIGKCTSFSSQPVVINSQPETPSSPVVGSVTQPTCTSATGSVSLIGLPSGSWTINPGGISGSGTNKTITGLVPGNYNYTVTNSSGCVSSATANVVINPQPLSISNNSINYSGETRNICSASTASQIHGSQPTGGNGTYAYIWESSTTGPDSGFSPATGTNNSLDYNPGNLTKTTWFRRVVNSGICGASTSNVIEVRVNPLPKLTPTGGDITICLGQSVNISGTLTGTGPWMVRGTINGAAFSVSSSSASLSHTFSPAQNTTVKISGITDANGCTNNEVHSISINVSAENIWTGAVDTNWNNTSNWSCNQIPTLQTNVLIPAGLSNYPDINSGAAALSKDIRIEDGASVIVDNYSIQIAGSINNSGTFNAVNGNITFIGNSAQTIPAGTFIDNRIKNLTLNNSSGVISQGALGITGILKAQSGNFDTGNDLTLISDEIRTALIDGSGTGEVLGTVKMQRYLNNSFGYKYFSSPFQNSTVGDFSSYINLNESFPNFYRYNENREDVNGNDATGWEVHTNSTSKLNPIEGYALNFGDSVEQKTVEINGTVNNGTYSRKLYNHNGIYTQGFNLVGNPYPSPIDWNAASGWTKTNVDDAIYFFTAGTTDRYTGTYTSFVDGVSTDGRSSSIIPSMQGFFVHVSDVTADASPTVGTLGMTNAVRVNNFSQPFLKQSEKQTPALIRITARFEGEKIADPTVIYFATNATAKFEKDLDAHKLMNTAVNVPNFYSFTPKREKLAISAISNAIGSEPERIPLGVNSAKAGAMVISLKDAENLSAGAYIYLVDEDKRIVQDLNSDPIYRFQVQKGETNSRFYLVFSNTRISDPAVIYNEPFSVETRNGQVLVRMNLKEGERGPLQISTVTGQIINVLEVTEKEVIEVQGIRSTGVYFISYLSGKETFTKKVLVKK
jgi:hypothetical protein